MTKNKLEQTTTREPDCAVRATTRQGATKKLKKIVALVLAIFAASLMLVGCGDEEPDDGRAEGLNELNRYFETVASAKSYTVEYSYTSGAAYSYYADQDKIKIDDNGTVTFYVNEEGIIYRIYSAQDETWHKERTDGDGEYLGDNIGKLAQSLNDGVCNSYDKATKTLSFTLNGETATITMEKESITVVMNSKSGKTTITIKDVGTTTVTLPNNIVDDMD